METIQEIENLITNQKKTENRISDKLAKELERAFKYVLTKVTLLKTNGDKRFVKNDLVKEVDLLYNEIVSMYPEYEDEFNEILPNRYDDDMISVDKYIKLASALSMLVFIKSFLEHMFDEIEHPRFDEFKDNQVLGYKLIDRLMKNVKHIIYVMVAWSTTFLDTGRMEDGAFKVTKAQVSWFKKMISDFLTYYTRYILLWEMHSRGVKEYTFYTSEDERVCSECGAIHGDKFKVSNAIVGTNFPPIHNGCRCWIVEDE